MKPLKPNTQAQLDRINVEICKKSKRWIYYNALGNPPDIGWCRQRACDCCFEMTLAIYGNVRYQLTPPRVSKGYVW